MKKILLLGFISTGIFPLAQINVAANPDLVGNAKNVFIDGSEFSFLANQSAAKGLNFPRTNLVTWTFNTSDLGQYQYSKTVFDGMVVYNTGTGNTGSTPATQGKRVFVRPGFYYFSNPDATEDTQDVSEGQWVRIGEDAVTRIDTTERVVRIVGGKEVYAVTGEFDLVSGGANNTTITFPSNMDSMYSIVIYRKEGNNNKLMGSSVYSYATDTTNSNKSKIVFGSGNISMSYPEGKYSYVLEYTKK